MGWLFGWLDKFFTSGVGADWSVVAVIPPKTDDGRPVYITLAENMTWRLAVDYAEVLNEHPTPRALGYPVEAVRTADALANNGIAARGEAFKTWRQPRDQ